MQSNILRKSVDALHPSPKQKEETWGNKAQAIKNARLVAESAISVGFSLIID